MPQALGSNSQGSPNSLRAHSLAGMSGQAQPRIARLGIQFAEWLRAGASFISSDADPHDTGELRLHFRGFAKNPCSFLRPEVPHRVEYPVDRDPEFRLRALPCPLHAFEEWFEFAVGPIVDHANRYIHFRMHHALTRQTLQHPPRDEFIIFSCSKALRDGFEGHQEPAEICVLKQRFRLPQLQRRSIMPGAKLNEDFGSNRAFEMQMELCFGQTSDEGEGFHAATDQGTAGDRLERAGKAFLLLINIRVFALGSLQTGTSTFADRLIPYNPGMGKKQGLEEFRRKLLAWFDENARDLPWRQTRDPYAIWVSETMLQQTRVAVVIHYYNRFIQKFPTLSALARADEADVLAQWSGLGYYRRARSLHEAARAIMAEHEGQIPPTAGGLSRLPGVGVYTAAAVASIAFGEPVAAIDGNVERVLTRYFGHEPVAGAARSGELRRSAEQLVDPQRPGHFNEAMMELGATVCLPRAPLCLTCPLHDECATRGEHAAPRTKKMLSEKKALALLQRRQWPRAEVLLEQRPADAAQMPGLWELPRVKEGREIEEATLLTVRHSITNTNYYVTVYALNANEQKLLVERSGERAWVPVLELHGRPLTGLALKILKRLKVMPGYSGAGPAAPLDQLPPDAAAEFDSAIFENQS